jgi:hypothetical protein
MAVLAWPQWIWDVLMTYWPALEAERQLHAVQAVLTPHQKPHAVRQTQQELIAYIRALHPPDAPEPMEHERIDPEAAAEWFREQGYRVVESG